MTNHETADPRESKLPQWAQVSLASMRSTIKELEEAVAILKGEVEGDSNVRILQPSRLGDTPLPKNSMVKFANKWGHITVCHERNGQVRIQGDNVLILHMLAGNSLTVELEDN
jgi:hypothetical protein